VYQMYYNRDGTPADRDTWAERFERADRIVCQSHLPNGIFVSTVFLGLNHSWDDKGPPLIFESMAFAAEEQEFTWPDTFPEDDPDFPNAKLLNEQARKLNTRKRTYHPDLDQVRYSTEAEALAGHLAMCEKFFAGSRLLPEVTSDGQQAQVTP
jgi:hypothetical protein